MNMSRNMSRMKKEKKFLWEKSVKFVFLALKL